MRRLPVSIAAGLTALALLALGAPLAGAQDVGADPAAEPPAEPVTEPVEAPDYRPTPRRSHTATLMLRTRVHATPDGAITSYLKPWISGTGNPVQLLVLAARLDDEDRVWLKVLLPSRPNGSTGWIRESDVEVRENPVRVEISVEQHRLRVLVRNRVVYGVGIAVGKPATPTPRGRFAVYQEVREPGDSPLGPWALHLTAHSNVLFEYKGGPGRVAIHGARGELFALPGTSVSNGCIRVPGQGTVRIVSLVRPGTPVDIVPRFGDRPRQPSKPQGGDRPTTGGSTT